jgi:hypothetical protein
VKRCPRSPITGWLDNTWASSRTRTLSCGAEASPSSRHRRGGGRGSRARSRRGWRGADRLAVPQSGSSPPGRVRGLRCRYAAGPGSARPLVGRGWRPTTDSRAPTCLTRSARSGHPALRPEPRRDVAQRPAAARPCARVAVEYVQSPGRVTYRKCCQQRPPAATRSDGFGPDAANGGGRHTGLRSGAAAGLEGEATPFRAWNSHFVGDEGLHDPRIRSQYSGPTDGFLSAPLRARKETP